MHFRRSGLEYRNELPSENHALVARSIDLCRCTGLRRRRKLAKLAAPMDDWRDGICNCSPPFKLADSGAIDVPAHRPDDHRIFGWTFVHTSGGWRFDHPVHPDDWGRCSDHHRRLCSCSAVDADGQRRRDHCDARFDPNGSRGERTSGSSAWRVSGSSHLCPDPADHDAGGLHSACASCACRRYPRSDRRAESNPVDNHRSVHVRRFCPTRRYRRECCPLGEPFFRGFDRRCSPGCGPQLACHGLSLPDTGHRPDLSGCLAWRGF